MKIADIGGEFEFIKRIASQKLTDKKIIKGIGDDCAVIDYSKDKYLLLTTDMMVENDHFNTSWQTPYQIGMKLMECNVSDIVTKGGTPKYGLISISIKKDTTVEFMDEFYKGIYASAEKYGVILIGGDTTHGTEYVFNLCLIGEIEKKLLRLRSMAKIGDAICVTGKLGGSTAGLKLLLHKKTGYLKDHLEPKSRSIQEGKNIAKFAHAMIDVSDGLGSEVRHICNESKVGAVIFHDKIPLSKTTLDSAQALKLDPYDFALYGGEDFQIVFTINNKDIEKLKKIFTDFSIVGKILPAEQGICILKDGKKLEVKKGYDHFA